MSSQRNCGKLIPGFFCKYVKDVSAADDRGFCEVAAISKGQSGRLVQYRFPISQTQDLSDGVFFFVPAKQKHFGVTNRERASTASFVAYASSPRSGRIRTKGKSV